MADKFHSPPHENEKLAMAKRHRRHATRVCFPEQDAPVRQLPAAGCRDKVRGMENGNSQLVARDLKRSFRMGPRRIEVLRGISMEVRRSEAVFLVGASGAGKTTLLYTLAGLERPEEGTVDFEGQRLYAGSSQTQAHIRNTQMGFVFQSYFLLPELTALENVMLPGMIGGRVMGDAAADSLRAVGLAERLQHLPAELSGGEQQRVAIARALVNDPAIVFADEPTGNLDSKTGEAIMDLLLSLARERKKTLLVVTHDPHLATLGDRQLHMADGVLTEG